MMIVMITTMMQVIVHFVRQSGSYITSCFIPTAMLGLLAYSTFFIHIDDFNDRCWLPWAMFMMMVTRMLMVMMILGLLAILLGGSRHDDDDEALYYQVHGIFDSSIGACLHDACLHWGFA